MLYTPQEIEHMKRRRKSLLWSFVPLMVVLTITWFFLYAELWRGSQQGVEDLMFNPFSAYKGLANKRSP